MSHEKKISNLNFINMKNFYTAKHTIKPVETEARDGEEILQTTYLIKVCYQ